jgi:hypothetical protein
LPLNMSLVLAQSKNGQFMGNCQKMSSFTQ